MAIMITDECINCGACEDECPRNAIKPDDYFSKPDDYFSISDQFWAEYNEQMLQFDKVINYINIR